MYLLKCSFVSDDVPYAFNLNRSLCSLVIWNCTSEFRDEYDEDSLNEDEDDYDKIDRALEGLASELQPFVPVKLMWDWQKSQVVG